LSLSQLKQNLVSQSLLRLAFYCWIGSTETIKILYVATCDCRGIGQPFNAWFFPAFQHPPYSSWFTFHGITWLSGPYSLLWWGLNSPAVLGYWVFFGYLLTCDIVVFALFWKKNQVYALYFLTLNVWFTTIDPVDFFPVLFAVAGRYRSVFLLLSPLTKLPVGSELWLGNLSVWSWVLHSPNSIQGPENYGRYLILGSVWLFSLVLYLNSRRRTRCFAVEDAAQATRGSSST